MKSLLPETRLRALDEDEAVAAVVESVRRLFPLVTEHQSRELAQRVLRTLAGRGVTLATERQEDAAEVER
ncbi:MAG TPA: hypothetical protein VHY82_03880 [Acetobacteraceae bacterium]|jgi:hypothetical protein|nr:hypothetical protein [Acetobacteraceae bacterium]